MDRILEYRPANFPNFTWKPVEVIASPDYVDAVRTIVADRGQTVIGLYEYRFQPVPVSEFQSCYRPLGNWEDCSPTVVPVDIRIYLRKHPGHHVTIHTSLNTSSNTFRLNPNYERHSR